MSLRNSFFSSEGSGVILKPLIKHCTDSASASTKVLHLQNILRGYLVCFLRGEELRSLNCAFSSETSLRIAAISFCNPVAVVVAPLPVFSDFQGGCFPKNEPPSMLWNC